MTIHNKQRNRVSKRGLKARKDIEQLKSWSTNRTKVDFVMFYGGGCTITYVGSLSEDIANTFSFSTDTLVAELPMPQMRILLDPTAWERSVVAKSYDNSPAIFVRNGTGRGGFTIRENSLHKILRGGTKPHRDAVLRQLRIWSRSEKKLWVCLLQASQAVFFNCRIFELPEEAFKFSGTLIPDFGVLIWLDDYDDLKIETALDRTKLILNSSNGNAAMLISEAADSLEVEEMFRNSRCKTSLIN